MGALGWGFFGRIIRMGIQDVDKREVVGNE
jgi:hypothetical protein